MLCTSVNMYLSTKVFLSVDFFCVAVHSILYLRSMSNDVQCLYIKLSKQLTSIKFSF